MLSVSLQNQRGSQWVLKALEAPAVRAARPRTRIIHSNTFPEFRERNSEAGVLSMSPDEVQEIVDTADHMRQNIRDAEQGY